MRVAELLPWRSFTIETSWPVEVAVVEIQKRMDARSIFGGGKLPFAGVKVSDDAFKFSLQSPFRHSGRPIVLVAVVPGPRGGSRIAVRMRLQLFVMALMTIWMSVALLGAVAASVAAVRRGHGAGFTMTLGLWAFAVLGAASIGIPFALGARKSERLLRAIFSNVPARPEPPDTGEAYR